MQHEFLPQQVVVGVRERRTAGKPEPADGTPADIELGTRRYRVDAFYEKITFMRGSLGMGTGPHGGGRAGVTMSAYRGGGW